MPYQSLRSAHMANLRRGYRLGHHSNREYLALKRKPRSGIKAALSKAKRKATRKYRTGSLNRNYAPGLARFAKNRLARRKKGKKAPVSTAIVAVRALTLAKENKRTLGAAVIEGHVHINIFAQAAIYPGTRGGDTGTATADIPGHYVLHGDYGWNIAKHALENHAAKSPGYQLLKSVDFDYAKVTWTFFRNNPWGMHELKNQAELIPYPYDMHCRFFIYEIPLDASQDDLRPAGTAALIPPITRYYEDATIQCHGGTTGLMQQDRKYTFGQARRETKAAKSELEHTSDIVYAAGREIFSQSFVLKAGRYEQYQASDITTDGTFGTYDVQNPLMMNQGVVSFDVFLPLDMVNVEEVTWTGSVGAETVQKLAPKNLKNRLICGVTHDWPHQLTDFAADQYGSTLPNWARPWYSQKLTLVYKGTVEDDVHA